jgi:hypothetical protein
MLNVTTDGATGLSEAEVLTFSQYAARLARTWWRDLKWGRRADEKSLMLEPYAFWPGQESSLTHEGGDQPSLVPGYAFHTNYVPSTGGTIRFRVKFIGLKGTRGKLAVSINVLDSRGLSAIQQPKVKEVSIERLIHDGGIIDINHLGISSHSYAAMGMLTYESDARAEGIEISVQGGDSFDALRTRLEAAQAGFLGEPPSEDMEGLVVVQPATLADPVSQMCTAHQVQEPIFAELCARLNITTAPHRKNWEFAYILRMLDHHGMLQEGRRGLGFGVGIEPMSSVFAAAGCQIVATDLAEQDERAQVWNETHQHGSDVERIMVPELCDPDVFRERVMFRPVDMNQIPDDLRGFDFCWSSCAYEHLGSISNGLAFFENSLDCLKPGGIAVHTTELNLSSNDLTMDHGSTVIFRRRDFEALAKRLRDAGHHVIPISFDSGDSELDRFIDLPPYSADSHLKLALLRWVSTSFGMAVIKGG